MKKATSHTGTTAMLSARLHLSRTVLLLLAALCACTADREGEDRGDTPPNDAAAESASANGKNVSALNKPDTAGWTAGLTAKPGSEMVTLLEVRTAAHDEFERIVFAFGPGPMPGYRVEYVDRPVRQCGSGEVVDLPGDAWLSIRLEPAQAHTEEGKPTVVERSRVLALENLKALKMICDFEGQVEWVAAASSPQSYRTLELKEPSRLVVDVRK
jgi:hypothetical protein